MSYEGPSLEGICRTHMSHVCMPPGPTCIGHPVKLYERKTSSAQSARMIVLRHQSDDFRVRLKGFVHQAI